MTNGVIGILIGVIFACLGLVRGTQIQRRQGSSHPMRDALGLGRARSPHGVEHEVRAQGARLAFPLYALFVVTVTLAMGHEQLAGVYGGAGGAIYGLSAAMAGVRLAR